ncbi:MAG: amino acid ABC transporter substrate-binding protein [Desulfobacterales bacterium]|nr:amino acid ABC transporter substrate-binding protein [Desulfobacterales bacterium]
MKAKSSYFIVLLFLLSSTVFSAEQVVIVTGEWAPYTSKNIQGHGFTAEIVSAVFDEIDIKIKYNFLPWKRCELYVLEGIAFASFPYHKTEEREKQFDFSDSIGESTWKFFYLKQKIQKDVIWKKLSDLKGYRIGCSLGNWYDKVFEDAGIVRILDYAPSDELSFRKLKAGRVDIVPTDELVGWSLIKRLFPQNVKDFGTVNKPLKSGKLHLMISRKYPDASELKKKFNAVLKRIRQNGQMDKILNKYM